MKIIVRTDPKKRNFPCRAAYVVLTKSTVRSEKMESPINARMIQCFKSPFVAAHILFCPMACPIQVRTLSPIKISWRFVGYGPI